VPESWLTFPIGTLKAAGAIGLAVGLLGWRPVGIAAGDRPCAVLRLRLYTHIRDSVWPMGTGVEIGGDKAPDGRQRVAASAR
jgi:hypothetical protein